MKAAEHSESAEGKKARHSRNLQTGWASAGACFQTLCSDASR